MTSGAMQQLRVFVAGGDPRPLRTGEYQLLNHRSWVGKPYPDERVATVLWLLLRATCGRKGLRAEWLPNPGRATSRPLAGPRPQNLQRGWEGHQHGLNSRPCARPPRFTASVDPNSAGVAAVGRRPQSASGRGRTPRRRRWHAACFSLESSGQFHGRLRPSMRPCAEAPTTEDGHTP